MPTWLIIINAVAAAVIIAYGVYIPVVLFIARRVDGRGQQSRDVLFAVIEELHMQGEQLILNSPGTALAEAGKLLMTRAHDLRRNNDEDPCLCPWAEADELAEEVEA